MSAQVAQGEGRSKNRWSSQIRPKQDTRTTLTTGKFKPPPPSLLQTPIAYVPYKYLKSFHLHLLELRLVLQVTDDSLLPADDGTVHSGLFQVLDAKLSHLQLGTQRSLLAPAALSPTPGTGSRSTALCWPTAAQASTVNPHSSPARGAAGAKR